MSTMHKPCIATLRCLQQRHVHRGMSTRSVKASSRPSIGVIGAGVLGLEAASRAVESMHGDVDVTIIAEGFFEQTTSYGCGGWWEPYLITGGEEKIHKWGKATFEHYVSLHHSADARRAGIQIQNKTDLQQEGEEKHSEPFWKDIVFNYQAFDREGVARRGFSDRFVGGHSFTAMVADQKYYLKYLMDKLEFWGVKFEQRKVHTLSSLAGEFDVVINCAGLGSRDLVEDSETYPVKGHVVRVIAPWMKECVFWGRSYIIPNVDTVVLGGTSYAHDWDTVPAKNETERILHDIYEVFPSMRDAHIERAWVGLRPARSAPRLDSEQIDCGGGRSLHVIHNYGHGGSGVTLAHGCAIEVVEEHLRPILGK